MLLPPPLHLQFQQLIEQGKEYRLSWGDQKWCLYKMHSIALYYVQRTGDIPSYAGESLDEAVFCLLLQVGTWKE